MSPNLLPWYAVATPHVDIREGRLEEAVFAADLWAVVTDDGNLPSVYRDPEQFFQKTYMTVGLGTVLQRVAAALAGKVDGGDRILGLQTSFGGGKTHSLISVYHLAKSAEKLAKATGAAGLRTALGNRFPTANRNVAVFTHKTCDAVQGREVAPGVRTHTLWGEIAWQLGACQSPAKGKELYDKVRPNDEQKISPQGLMVDILREAAPCLILIDELADYCVPAMAVKVGETTLADQTVSFIQQLEEAVAQVPGAVLVATLPASKLEVAQSEKGQEIFSALEKRFQRLGADVKPVADNEIYHVVRTRLFDSIAPANDPDYPRKVAEAYSTMYQAHANEVPAEYAKPGFREQLENSFPFHPAIVDTLYTRWGSHPDFQRTRGVLRLLAAIVGDLWNRRNGNTRTQHLIQPAHIRWSVDALAASLTRLWGPGYQSVVAADVHGEKSNARTLDESRAGDYLREGIGEGMAAAMLLGSFGGQAQRSGFNAKDLKAATARVGVNWNYADGALLELEENSFYLQMASAGNAGKRYWYGIKPTLNKLLVQYRQQLSKDTFEQPIIDALKDATTTARGSGVTWRVLVNPENDLPEQKSLTLLVLPPELAWGDEKPAQDAVKKRVLEISSKCGSRDRHYRNTLLFLAAGPRGLSKLRQAHRDLTAFASIRRDYGDQLDTDQREDLKGRIETATKSAAEALGPAYTVALRVRGQEVESVSLGDARASIGEHLTLLWNTLVEDEEWILRKVGSVTLQKNGLILKEGDAPMRLTDAVESFLRYTDKPVVATKEAVVDGVSMACKDGLVGIARGATPSNLQTKYCRQDVTLDASEDGVWIIPKFDPAQPKAPDADGASSSNPVAGSGGVLAGGGGPAAGSATDGAAIDAGTGTNGQTSTGAASSTRKVRKFAIKGNVALENYGELFRCFINPATRLKLKGLKIGVSFEMDAGEGLEESNASLKGMKEAAQQLGLKYEEE